MGEIFERVLPPKPLEWTGERLTSGVAGQVEIEHLHRYFLARELCRDLNVLDVAAGEGYGSALIAQTANFVVGLEIAPSAIAHAAKAYVASNLHFIVGDARRIPLDKASMDVIVSFETIEHFNDHRAFLREVRRILRPGGKFILSTPERDVYSPAGTLPNPYHVHELTRTELVSLLNSEFPYVAVQAQRPFLGSALIGETRTQAVHQTFTFERRGPSLYETSVGLPRPVYLVAIASDQAIECFPDSLFIETSSVGEILDECPRLRQELERSSKALSSTAGYARDLEKQLQERDSALAKAHEVAQGFRENHESVARTLSDAFRDLANVKTSYFEAVKELEIAKLERDRAAASAARELEVATLVRDKAAASADFAHQERDAARAELASVKEILTEAGVYARHVEREYAKALAEVEKAVPHIRMLEHQLAGILNSRSWRALAPLRALINRARGVRTGIDLGQSKGADGQGLQQLKAPSPRETARSPSIALKTDLVANLNEVLSSDERVVFDAPSLPVISVIVVTWNQAQFTLGCLRALQREALSPVSPPLQVIVVDNGSSDETAQLLDKLDGVQIIRNQSNAGFVRAVNQGATRAQGDYLLLLNNDAFLRPGTLSVAEATLRRDIGIGAVGARIVLPSGFLQEAGSIIWSDGSTLGYARGQSADAAEAMFRREVDYCSAAFLMTPRRIWQKLEGFDETYAPAYYEDADYCMRLREVGLKVIYEPAAVIDHFENGSEIKLGAAAEACLKNRPHFRKRHADSLRRKHLPYLPQNLLLAREHGFLGKRRLLVFDNEVPLMARGSGYPRMRMLLLEAAAAGWSVSFYAIHEPNIDWNAARSEIPWEIEIIPGCGAEGLSAFLYARRGYYKCIVVSRPDNMAILRPILDEHPQLLDDARLIYDAEALFSGRIITNAELNGEPLGADEVGKLIEQEITLAKRAHAVICVNDAEAKLFRSSQGAPVHVLGHPAKLLHNTAKFESRSGLLFVGRLMEKDSPNWRGLSWFIREIWPLIDTKLPQIELLVIGRLHPDHSELGGPRVRLLGPAKDLFPLYDSARVFVAPVQFAAGIPIKILEATAAGLPTVGTGLMARQLGWAIGSEILARDDAELFASAVVELHENRELWCAMQSAATRRLGAEHSPEKFREGLKMALAA